MTKQFIVNEILMNSDNKLVLKYSDSELRDMYVKMIGDTEERDIQQYIYRLRLFVNKTYTHNGITHNLYAVHTIETDTFRAVNTINRLYGPNTLLYNGVINVAYKQLIISGSAESKNDKIKEMEKFLREHDAPAIYSPED